VKPRQPQFLGAGFPCFLHEPTGPVSPVVPVQGAAFVLLLVEASSHEIGILSVLIVTLYDLVDLVTIVLVETTGREVRRPDVEPTAGDSVVLQVVVQLRHHRLCQAQPPEIFLDRQAGNMAQSFDPVTAGERIVEVEGRARFDLAQNVGDDFRFLVQLLLLSPAAAEIRKRVPGRMSIFREFFDLVRIGNLDFFRHQGQIRPLPKVGAIKVVIVVFGQAR